MTFSNVYDDERRAQAYATLDFPGTYYLAYRDLPALVEQYVRGRSALDFGCGAGRSTRFLKGLGFDATGIDVSASMVALAKKADPAGDYRVVPDGDFSSLRPGHYDLILSAFAFDNIPGEKNRQQLLTSLGRLLHEDGRIVMVASTPEIYWHEWASFSTRQFPDNASAKSGESVRIVMRDVDDARPVIDSIWFPEDYRKIFAGAALDVMAEHRPLGRRDEHYAWLTETAIAPWVIYVLRRSTHADS